MDREKISFSSEYTYIAFIRWILVLSPPHPNRAGYFHSTRLSKLEFYFNYLKLFLSFNSQILW